MNRLKIIISILMCLILINSCDHPTEPKKEVQSANKSLKHVSSNQTESSDDVFFANLSFDFFEMLDPSIKSTLIEIVSNSSNYTFEIEAESGTIKNIGNHTVRYVKKESSYLETITAVVTDIKTGESIRIVQQVNVDYSSSIQETPPNPDQKVKVIPLSNNNR